MQTDQKSLEKQSNSLNSSNGEPESAHATHTVEKYVKKRKEKAEQQTKTENKSIWDWGSIKYVIL